MVIQIKVDSEAVDLLYKYCRKTPVEMIPLVTRLVREWCKLAAPKWYNDYKRIPAMPPIPESRQTSVGIPVEWGNKYKDDIKRINDKWEKEGKTFNRIQMDELTSILLVAYIKRYKVKEKAEWYRARNWGNPG